MEIINGIKTESDLNLDNPDIDGGTIDGSTIGGNTPAAGSFTTVNASDVVTLEKEITIKEITTPSPVGSYGKLYTKSDNILYFQDGAGTEHAIVAAGRYYGEVYISGSSDATVIETADTPIALRVNILAGNLDGWTFGAGSTAGITAFADYGGTVTGAVLATSTHGLTTGDIITIRGTTNYNGIFQITVVDSTHFYFTAIWVADDGASDYDQPARVIAGVGAAGTYAAIWQMSTASASTQTLIWKMNINITPCFKSTAERIYTINNLYNTCSSSCIFTIADGDVIWLSVQADGTGNITNKHGEYHLLRL